MAEGQAVVVLLTAEDQAGFAAPARQGPGSRHAAPGPASAKNVILEAGLAFGVDPDRTILVEARTNSAGRAIRRLETLCEMTNEAQTRKRSEAPT